MKLVFCSGMFIPVRFTCKTEVVRTLERAAQVRHGYILVLSIHYTHTCKSALVYDFKYTTNTSYI